MKVVNCIKPVPDAISVGDVST